MSITASASGPQITASVAEAGVSVSVGGGSGVNAVVTGGIGPTGPAGDAGGGGSSMVVTVGRSDADYNCTGTLGSPTDHSTIQSAINAVQTAGGGTVFIKAGVYFLGGTISVTVANVQIVGEGRGTELRAVGDYGNVFLCALPTVPTQWPGLAGLRFESLRFETTVDRTTGACIRANYTHNAVFRDLYMADGTYGHSFGLVTPVPKMFYDGIYLDGQNQCTVENVVAMCLRRCVHANGSTYENADFSYDGTVRNCKFWGKPGTPPAGSIAVHLINCGGFVVDFCSTNNHEHAVVADCTTSPISGTIFTLRGGYAENNVGHDYVVTGYAHAVIDALWGTLEFNGDGTFIVCSVGQSFGIEINGDAFAIINGVVTITNPVGSASYFRIGPEDVRFSDGTIQTTAFTGDLKAKLDGIAAGATANATNAQLRDRSTHTGTQSAGTITGLAAVATSGSASDLSSGTLPVARLPGVPVYLQQTTPPGSGWVWFQTNGSGDVIDIITG